MEYNEKALDDNTSYLILLGSIGYMWEIKKCMFCQIDIINFDKPRRWGGFKTSNYQNVKYNLRWISL